MSKSITKLDFEEIKQSIIDHMSNQERFKDFDYAGSNMSILLDVLAYNTFINNVYTNMAFSEAFIDSAQLRESIVSHAKDLNYLPRSVSSPVANVKFTFVPTDSPSSIIIPRYTELNGNSGNRTFKFLTTESVAVNTNESGEYISSDVEVKQGRVVTELYSVTSSLDHVLINNENVDISTVRIEVANGSDFTPYNFKSSIFGVEKLDKVFYMQPYLDNLYEIKFGGDIFGAQPKNGDTIKITYIVSDGEAANGVDKFSRTTQIDGYNATIETTVKAQGGAERESIESIRFYAPKSIQTQERAVTKSDYEIILKNEFPEIRAVSAWGGEEMSPPRYGKVIVSVDTVSGEGLSLSNKNRFLDFLDDKSPISIDPIIQDPEFIFLELESKVHFNTKLNSGSSADIIALVKAAVKNYSDKELSDFKKTLRLSKLATDIDNSSSAILSSSNKVKMVMEVSPIFGEAIDIITSFENPIKESAGSLVSSIFSYNGQSSCYLYSNQDGSLDIVRDGGSVIRRKIGSVDYESGNISIYTFVPDSYPGPAIKIYADPVNAYISARKNKIILIRPSDTIIETYAK